MEALTLWEEGDSVKRKKFMLVALFSFGFALSAISIMLHHMTMA